MKIRDLKDGLKPFFIFVILFEVIYEIVAIILGYPILIIADKIQMRKYYKNYKKRIKTDQRQEEQTADLRKRIPTLSVTLKIKQKLLQEVSPQKKF